MSSKRRGLGRGLEALLGDSVTALSANTGMDAAKTEMMRMIPIEKIQRGQYQPRVYFEPEALQALADSIRSQGILQPIVVRPIGDQYELIAGERRWRAAQLAEIQEIPAVVRADLPDDSVAAIALIENIQRENLNSLEEANAFQRLINEFSMSHQQVADAVGRSRAAVTNLLRLRDLQPEVRRMLEHSELDMGHARALLSLPANLQLMMAHQVIAKKLSVRETERRVKKTLLSEDSPQRPESTLCDPDIQRLEQQLSDQLGARIEIQHKPSGKGKLVVHYASADELDGILKRIK